MRALLLLFVLISPWATACPLPSVSVYSVERAEAASPFDRVPLYTQGHSLRFYVALVLQLADQLVFKGSLLSHHYVLDGYLESQTPGP